MTEHGVRRGPARVLAVALSLGLLLAGCSAATDVRATPPSRGDTSRSAPATTPAEASGSAPTPSGSTDEPQVPADLGAGLSDPVEDPYYPDLSNPEVDVLHYGLRLTYDAPTLSGTATVTFRATGATDTIRLDLSDALDRGVGDASTVARRRTRMPRTG